MAKISIPGPRARPRFEGVGTSKPAGASSSDDDKVEPPAPRRPLEEPPAPRPPWRIAGVLGFIVVVVVAVKAFRSAPESLSPRDPDMPVATASATASATAAPVVPPRCVEANAEGFVIGELPKPKDADDAGPDTVTEDPNAPFAVEVGRGAAIDGGFAIGALRDAEGGAVAMVATMGLDGKNGKLVRLARARTDLDPPVVASAGSAVMAAFLEPNAGGRSVKIAKVTGDQVAWGPEFQEGKDESNALDIAATATRAIVTWDDATGDEGRSAVFVTAIDVGTLGVTTPPRAASRKETEGDTPRVVLRPGGYWLAWVAHNERTEAEAKKKKPKPKPLDDENSDETDTDTPAGETIDHRWIEVMPLDEVGAPGGAPRAATSKTGNVLAYDLKLGADGAALVAYRDDDAPTGSSGGKLGAVLVKADGAIEAHPFEDDATGVGAPTLLPGWISIGGVSGRGYLGAISDHGQLLGPMEIEPALANGEIMAGAPSTLLVAKPAGRAVRLVPMTCTPRPAGAPAASAAPSAAPAPSPS